MYNSNKKIKKTEINLAEAEKNIRAQMKEQGASKKDIDVAIKQLRANIDNVELPKIAIIGFTGVGKSTTLNALFNAGQPTSSIRACTQEEAPIIGDVSKYTGSKGSVIIYDMPGLGEDIYADKKHFETYIRILPVVDIAVWTFHTGDRAMTPMQEALQGLTKYLGNDFQKKLMFAINKADAISPGESAWLTELNTPSLEQRRNIEEIESYVRQKVHMIMPEWDGPIVTYSARTRFRLDQLMTAMVETLSKEKRWVLEGRADVANPIDLIDKRYYGFVKDLQNKKIPDKDKR